MGVVQGLEIILTEYASLNMWEDENDESTRPSAKEVMQLEALAVRRSVLLALVFNHLCYFHPKMVTLEDSPNGLSLRLGISIDLLTSAAEIFSREPFAAASCADILAAKLPEGCTVFQSSPVGTIVVLQVAIGETKLAFAFMKGVWTLWANSVKDNAQVLTECGHVQKYFAFDAAVVAGNS